ncbi:MAG TPA: family 2A encapsulin nanocompartment cargo protein cysteine desulfurase [Puia sp.]|nr:family 2A encapsulin nanocompartment cargo protein cysteine desulfurase [Puia sp.]
MSTNNSNEFSPLDEGALAQLANQFFKAMPGEAVANLGAPLSYPGETAPATAGAVTSPFPGAGGAIPASVAGSGISPSAVQRQESFDLKSPPTSLPDPHFAGRGHVPSSVAGSGISPSAMRQKDNVEDLHSPVGRAQLPQAPSAIPSFYFLPGQEALSLTNGLPGLSTRSLTDGGGISGMTSPPFDVNRVRNDFPILQERVNGRPLVWLDNAATTQKPWQVISRLSHFYEHENSNIHRAAHELAARATDAYESARKKVADFLNASSVNEIVFVRGSTEAINLVAKSWGEQNLKEGDEIIISYLEHHANIVPWQQLAAKNGAKLKVIPVDDDGQVLLDEYARLLGPRTRIVSFTQVSNALGTITPAKLMVEMAHQAGAKVLVDGAQAVSHMRADVRLLDCDWYVFSGHKVFGPTGIGVLYGKEALLNETAPWQGGGNMIQDVTFEQTKYHQAPARFEAGTGNIADAVGLGAAIDYVNKIGMELIGQYEHYLLLYATKLLRDVPGLRLIGTAAEKAGVLSFVMDGYRTEEIGSALNEEGIAVRSGHHCAQPILRRFGVESTVRPSLALYNTCADIDALVRVLHRLRSGRKK